MVPVGRVAFAEGTEYDGKDGVVTSRGIEIGDGRGTGVGSVGKEVAETELSASGVMMLAGWKLSGREMLFSEAQVSGSLPCFFFFLKKKKKKKKILYRDGWRQGGKWAGWVLLFSAAHGSGSLPCFFFFFKKKKTKKVR